MTDDQFKRNEEQNRKIQERIKNDRLKKNKEVLKDYNINPKPPTKPNGDGTGGASNHLAY